METQTKQVLENISLLEATEDFVYFGNLYVLKRWITPRKIRLVHDASNIKQGLKHIEKKSLRFERPIYDNVFLNSIDEWLRENNLIAFGSKYSEEKGILEGFARMIITPDTERYDPRSLIFRAKTYHKK